MLFKSVYQNTVSCIKTGILVTWMSDNLYINVRKIDVWTVIYLYDYGIAYNKMQSKK